MVGRDWKAVEIFDERRVGVAHRAEGRTPAQAGNRSEIAPAAPLLEKARQGLFRLAAQDEIDKREGRQGREVDSRRLRTTKQNGRGRFQALNALGDADRKWVT